MSHYTGERGSLKMPKKCHGLFKWPHISDIKKEQKNCITLTRQLPKCKESALTLKAVKLGFCLEKSWPNF